jgi:hypothetical protein
LIDIFAHEYGWTPSQILSMPITGAIVLIDRIRDRYPEQAERDKLISVESFEGMMKVQ